ncbi:MAG: M28 family peptidase [Oscillatoriales cyanobacterium C42_A2020_001]|nr:M28 family peptidase [Leptolyngbyaceae cyanobacterium C42_A2020_001]
MLGLAGCQPPQALKAEERQFAGVSPTAIAQQSPTAPAKNSDVEALINMGPRVAGTPVMEQASTYLQDEFRKAGYVATIQTFTYSKFVDQGSTLTVDGAPISGRALQGTIPQNLTARLVAVPNVGRPSDFAGVDVKGAIAIVVRGEIPFGEKAQNAAQAGAVGLVIVNNQSGNFAGTLNREVTIPVLAMSKEQGEPLLARSRQGTFNATLAVNARRQDVIGRNVVAHLANVTQPKVLLGGHYDSVAGSPGANDNASGTAVVLAIARNLAKTDLARQAWFVAFDGEEDGLHGSRAFVKSASPNFLKGLKGMMNFDMVGINEQLRASGSPELTKLAKVADSDVAMSGSSNNGGSDHASFATAGVPVLFFHRGLDPNYHKPSDKVVNPKLLDETTETALNVLRQLFTSESGMVDPESL